MASIRVTLPQELRTDERLNELEPLLAFFATFVLDSPVVRQIMRWDMVVLRESPWYQEILKEGLDQGFQRGSRREALTLVSRLLVRRVGIEAGLWQERLASLSLEQLETLAEDLLDFSTEADLVAWMEQSEVGVDK